MNPTNDIEFHTQKEIPLEHLLALYNAVGWGVYTNEKNRDQLQTAVRNSTYVLTAWKDNTLIGLARALTDDVSIFYLQDILIHPDYQRHGLGRTLLADCLQRYKHVRTKLLLTDNEEKQLKFYQSMGFKNTRHLTSIIINAFIQMEGIDLN